MQKEMGKKQRVVTFTVQQSHSFILSNIKKESNKIGYITNINEKKFFFFLEK